MENQRTKSIDHDFNQNIASNSSSNDVLRPFKVQRNVESSYDESNSTCNSTNCSSGDSSPCLFLNLERLPSELSSGESLNNNEHDERDNDNNNDKNKMPLVNWTTLPQDIMYKIFENLDYTDILNLITTNKKWYQNYNNSNYIWKKIFRRDICNQKFGYLDGNGVNKSNSQFKINNKPFHQKIIKKSSNTTKNKTLYQNKPQNQNFSTFLSPQYDYKNIYKKLVTETPSVSTHILKDCKDEVLHVSFSPDGKFLAVCAKDAIFRIYSGSHPYELLFKNNMSKNAQTRNWEWCQAAHFSPESDMVMVSGVFSRAQPYLGELAVFAIKSEKKSYGENDKMKTMSRSVSIDDPDEMSLINSPEPILPPKSKSSKFCFSPKSVRRNASIVLPENFSLISKTQKVLKPYSFTLISRIQIKPHDVFGCWHGNNHVISCKTQWHGGYPLISEVFLNKICMDAKDMFDPSIGVVDSIFKFANKNWSVIRMLNTMKITKDVEECADRLIVPKDENEIDTLENLANVLYQTYNSNSADRRSSISESHYSRHFPNNPASASDNVSDNSTSMDESDSDNSDNTNGSKSSHSTFSCLKAGDYLIAAKGSRVWTPHELGLKLLKPKTVSKILPRGISVSNSASNSENSNNNSISSQNSSSTHSQSNSHSNNNNSMSGSESQPNPNSVWAEILNDHQAANQVHTSLDLDSWDKEIAFEGQIIGFEAISESQQIIINVRDWILTDDQKTNPETPFDPANPPALSKFPRLLVFSISQWAIIRELSGHKALSPANRCCFLMPSASERLAACGDETGKVYVWEYKISNGSLLPGCPLFHQGNQIRQLVSGKSKKVKEEEKDDLRRYYS